MSQEPLDLWFRPSRMVVVTAIMSGLIGILGFVAILTSGRVNNSPALLILVSPIIIALLVAKRNIHLTDEGLETTSLFKRRMIAWTDFVRIDQTRKSYVFVTNRGTISAGWIDPKQRERLFRKTLERAKLIFRPVEPRWGLKAQYIRREQPITVHLPKPNSDKGKASL